MNEPSFGCAERARVWRDEDELGELSRAASFGQDYGIKRLTDENVDRVVRGASAGAGNVERGELLNKIQTTSFNPFIL